jgi:hypothetical protein
LQQLLIAIGAIKGTLNWVEGIMKMVRRSIFDQIFREMQNIRFWLDDMENNMASWNPQPLEISE